MMTPEEYRDMHWDEPPFECEEEPRTCASCKGFGKDCETCEVNDDE